VLKSSWKPCPRHILRRQQGHDGKENDAAPREDPQRGHEDAGVHWPTFSDRHRSGKSYCRGCGARGRAVVSVKWSRQTGWSSLSPTLERTAVLFYFDVDDFGIPRAEAAQPTAYGSRIMPFVEELLPLVIGRPKALAAVIPASNRAIGSGSKCNAIGHLRASVSLSLQKAEPSAATASQIAAQIPSDSSSTQVKDSPIFGPAIEEMPRDRDPWHPRPIDSE